MTDDNEVIERLLKEDEGFKRAFNTHKDYDRKIEELEKKQHLTTAETIETKRLKKLKLALKDELEEMISRHRSSQV